MEIDAAHWHMAHVLDAANQANAGIAGHDHTGRIVQRRAQTVDRICWYRMRDLRQQRRVSGDVKTLLEGLLHATVDIVYRACLKRRIARQRATHLPRAWRNAPPFERPIGVRIASTMTTCSIVTP